MNIHKSTKLVHATSHLFIGKSNSQMLFSASSTFLKLGWHFLHVYSFLTVPKAAQHVFFPLQAEGSFKKSKYAKTIQNIQTKSHPKFPNTSLPVSSILLMAEILHQLIGSLSRYFYGFIHPRWCRISAINSIIPVYPLSPASISRTTSFLDAGPVLDVVSCGGFTTWEVAQSLHSALVL